MAIDGLKVVSIKEFKLDLTENARITSPGSFKKLENLWSKNPGSIEQRPGSVLFAAKVVVGELRYNESVANGTIEGVLDTFGNPPKLDDLIFDIANSQLPKVYTNVRVDLTHSVLATVPSAKKFSLPTAGTVLWNRIFT